MKSRSIPKAQAFLLTSSVSVLAGCVLLSPEERWWGGPSGEETDSAVDSGEADSGATDSGADSGAEDADLDGDGYDVGSDCDDGEPGVNPDAAEVCNGVDDDCDGDTDEDSAADAPAWYPDADGDGYGTEGTAAVACEPPAGFGAGSADCDDADAGVNPGEFEICGDEVDQDCGGQAEDCALSGSIDLRYADARLLGEAAGDHAGVVAGAGDVNGDGRDDLLFGADSYQGVGAAYLVLGPVSGDFDLSAATARLIGQAAGDYAGSALDYAGDVDGDGYDDVLVGAYNHGAGSSYAGAVYLLLGPLSGDVALSGADAVFFGGDDQSIGASVAGGGDLDADEAGEVLIGTRADDDGGYNAGAVYVVETSARGEVDISSAQAKLDGEGEGDNAGNSAAIVGDVDGDGIDDLLVGAYYHPLGAYNGASYLVLGPADSDRSLASADAKLVGESPGDYAGYSVAGAGDVDGDGLDDLLIGAYGDDDTASDAGAVYILHYPLSGAVSLADAAAKLVGESGDDQAGLCVAGAGDVDGDGWADLLIGAPYADDGGPDAGAVYLARGPVAGTVALASAAAKLTGEGELDNAGLTVAGAGDVDGDGGADVAVGTYRQDDAGIDAGAVYLLYGGSE